MTTRRDYYDTLGIPRTASEEDIRKAFRRKALEFHPDRNKDPKASDRFKEVNEAYQVLTDPQRRAQYDQFGHSGFETHGSQFTNGFDAGDFLGGFGSIFDAFFGGSTATRTRARPGRDIQVDLRISFNQSAFGISQDVTVNRQGVCEKCKGSRSEAGHNAEPCTNCGGSGQVRRAHRSIFGQFVQQSICNVCSGLGEVIKFPCPGCRGTGKERHQRRIKIDVPAGIQDGVHLQLRGEGDLGEHGAPSGDLFILVRVEPHPFFRRSEFNVLYDLELTFPQLALGDEVLVPTLENKVKLKIPAGTQTGSIFRLKGQGIPHLGKDSRRGDELVTVHGATPKDLTKHQHQLLEELQRSFGPNSDPKV